MKMRKNARPAPLRREEMAGRVIAGQVSRAEAAASFGVTAKTAPKRVGRASGASAPPAARITPRCPAGRAGPRQGMSSSGSSPCGAIAWPATGVSTATVGRVLKRAGLSRLRDLEPDGPARRYRHDRPGGMTRTGVKKLGRFDGPGCRATGTRAGHRHGAGRERARVCVDDASRVACGGPLPDGRRKGAIECLRVSADCHGRLGVAVRRVTVGNGPCYASRAFAVACKALGMSVALRAEDQRCRRGSPDGLLAGAGLRPDLREVRIGPLPTFRRVCACMTGTGSTPHWA